MAQKVYEENGTQKCLRCKSCGRLGAKVSTETVGAVEIKCARCGEVTAHTLVDIKLSLPVDARVSVAYLPLSSPAPHDQT